VDKESYRFIVQCLRWSIVLVVIASIGLAYLKLDGAQLASIGTLPARLLLVPPR